MIRIVLFILSILFVVSASAQTRRPVPTPKPTQTPAQSGSALPAITRIRLDKNQITIPCPVGYKPMDGDEECPFDPASLTIKVEVTTSAPVKDNISYEYSATGGTITGKGPVVEWSVDGLDPGTYKMTAALVNGKVRSNSKSVLITVSQCRSCANQCACPDIKITGPQAAKAGEIVTFTVGISSNSQEEITYNWTVSEGDIVTGQGTASIQVQTYSSMAGRKVLATVIIGGLNPACNCPSEKSLESPELTAAEKHP